MKKLTFHTGSIQIEKLESLPREESIIQNYALAARALRGDTIYHRYPYIETPSGARLGSYVEDKREIRPLEKSFEIFPNPFDRFITIKGLIEEDCIVKFYDLSSRLIYETKINGIESIQISTEHIQSGAYFLEVSSINGNRIITEKIVK